MGKLACFGLPRLSTALVLIAIGWNPAAAQDPQEAKSSALTSAAVESTKGRPIRLQLSYGSDAQLLASGERHGADYVGRLGFIADADLEQLLGWRGATAHLSIHQIHGRGLSAHRIGNLLAVSGLEAEPALRLFNVWIEQKIGSNSSLRVGQFTAGQEFAISDTGALFVNSTFGWPASFANDLPSGGPAYPLAAPGVRLQYSRRDSRTFRVALFAGDPAGPGHADPQRRDVHGFNGLRLAGRPFLIGEIQQQLGSSVVRLGGWHHFGDFADRRTGSPNRHRGNSALYAIVDAPLWHSRRQPKRAVTAFVRASVSPSDRNIIDRYADAGVTLTGPFRNRPDDTVGVSFALAHVSGLARPDRGDADSSNGRVDTYRHHEAVVEFSYQIALGRAAYLQPNLQYVIHPGGGLLDAEGNHARNALVIGLRTSLRIDLHGTRP